MPPKRNNNNPDTENQIPGDSTSQHSPLRAKAQSADLVVTRAVTAVMEAFGAGIANLDFTALANARVNAMANASANANANANVANAMFANTAAVLNAPTDNRLEANNKDSALMKNENAALTGTLAEVVTLSLPSPHVINRDTVVPEDPYDENDGSIQAPQGTPVSRLIVRAVRSKKIYGIALRASDPNLNRDFSTAVQDIAADLKADNAYVRLPDDELHALCALLVANNRQLCAQSQHANNRGAIRLMTLHVFAPTSDLSINDPTVNPLAIYTGFETWVVNLLAILLGFIVVSGATGGGSSTDPFGYDQSRVLKTLPGLEPVIGGCYSSVDCIFRGRSMTSLLTLSGAFRIAGNIGSQYASTSSKEALSLSGKSDRACKSLFAFAGLLFRSAVRTARSDVPDTTELATPANNANAANRAASAPTTVVANNTASSERQFVERRFRNAAKRMLRDGVDYGRGFLTKLAEHLSTTKSTERPSNDSWPGSHMRRCEEQPRDARPPRHQGRGRGGGRRDRDGHRTQGRRDHGPVLGNNPDASAPATTGGARS